MQQWSRKFNEDDGGGGGSGERSPNAKASGTPATRNMVPAAAEAAVASSSSSGSEDMPALANGGSPAASGAAAAIATAPAWDNGANGHALNGTSSSSTLVSSTNTSSSESDAPPSTQPAAEAAGTSGARPRAKRGQSGKGPLPAVQEERELEGPAPLRGVYEVSRRWYASQVLHAVSSALAARALMFLPSCFWPALTALLTRACHPCTQGDVDATMDEEAAAALWPQREDPEYVI